MSRVAGTHDRFAVRRSTPELYPEKAGDEKIGIGPTEKKSGPV